MANLASVEDLQKLMRRTFAEGEDLDQADSVLTIVSAWARSLSGQAWPDAPTGVPADVQGVVLTACRRDLRNPDGSIVAKAKGPFSVQYKQAPDGFFTEPELSILRRFKSKAGGLFTVGTTRGERAGRLPAFLYWDKVLDDPVPAFEFGSLGWDSAIPWEELDERSRRPINEGGWEVLDEL